MVGLPIPAEFLAGVYPAAALVLVLVLVLEPELELVLALELGLAPDVAVVAAAEQSTKSAR